MVEYQSEFEKIKYQMEQLNPLFSEAYFVSSFIGGMRNEVAAAVRTFKPATVISQFAEQAKLQAQRISSDRPRLPSFQSNTSYKAGPKLPIINYNQPILSPKPISSYSPKHNPHPQQSTAVQRKSTVAPLQLTSQNPSAT